MKENLNVYYETTRDVAATFWAIDWEPIPINELPNEKCHTETALVSGTTNTNTPTIVSL